MSIVLEVKLVFMSALGDSFRSFVQEVVIAVFDNVKFFC